MECEYKLHIHDIASMSICRGIYAYSYTSHRLAPPTIKGFFPMQLKTCLVFRAGRAQGQFGFAEPPRGSPTEFWAVRPQGPWIDSYLSPNLELQGLIARPRSTGQAQTVDLLQCLEAKFEVWLCGQTPEVASRLARRPNGMGSCSMLCHSIDTLLFV